MRVVIAVADPQARDDICTILKMCLPELGLSLVDSASRCIKIVREDNPDPVIVDYNLPDLCGPKIIAEIRAISPSPIVVLSYLKDDTDMLKAIECGADEFCIMPIKQLEFAAHIRALLRRRRRINRTTSITKPGAVRSTRTTIGLRKETKVSLDRNRVPGQCYDGLLCQMVDLWEKSFRMLPYPGGDHIEQNKLYSTRIKQ